MRYKAVGFVVLVLLILIAGYTRVLGPDSHKRLPIDTVIDQKAAHKDPRRTRNCSTARPTACRWRTSRY